MMNYKLIIFYLLTFVENVLGINKPKNLNGNPMFHFLEQNTVYLFVMMFG